MTTKIDELREMLAADGYRLHLETSVDATDARITADEGVCNDCLVPKKVMTGLLASALSVPAESIRLSYPVEK